MKALTIKEASKEVGKRYGRVTLKKFIRMNIKSERVYLGKCSCGVTKEFVWSKLTNGTTKSCGCYAAERAAVRTSRIAKKYLTTHGYTGTKTYHSWKNMRTRVSPNYYQRAYYYDRGITVCDRWNKFENFLEDMGPRPEGTTLDRKNNDGIYEPGNCRWADATTQSRNRRGTKYIKEGMIR